MITKQAPVYVNKSFVELNDTSVFCSMLFLLQTKTVYWPHVRVTEHDVVCVWQFDQGGLSLQKDEYSNKTETSHKVCM